jgi:membrane protein
MRTARLGIVRTVWSIGTATYASWRDHRTIRLGAGLAYYGLFSLSSVLAVAVGLVQLVGHSTAVEEEISRRVVEVVGPQGAESVAAFFETIDGPSGTSVGLIGLGSLLVTGSLFFLALEDAFNQIWDVPVALGLATKVRRRLFSLLVLLATAVVLVVALAVQASSAILERLLPGTTPGLEAFASLLSSALGWLLLAASLALLLKYLPAVETPWRPVLVTAVVTGALIVIGTALVGWYLRTVGVSSVGGVASTPIMVLVWIYYEAQMLLVGAHLAKILTARRSSS